MENLQLNKNKEIKVNQKAYKIIDKNREKLFNK